MSFPPLLGIHNIRKTRIPPVIYKARMVIPNNSNINLPNIQNIITMPKSVVSAFVATTLFVAFLSSCVRLIKIFENKFYLTSFFK